MLDRTSVYYVFIVSLLFRTPLTLITITSIWSPTSSAITSKLMAKYVSAIWTSQWYKMTFRTELWMWQKFSPHRGGNLLFIELNRLSHWNLALHGVKTNKSMLAITLRKLEVSSFIQLQPFVFSGWWWWWWWWWPKFCVLYKQSRQYKKYTLCVVINGYGRLFLPGLSCAIKQVGQFWKCYNLNHEHSSTCCDCQEG